MTAVTVDWDAVRAETVGHLQRLIRCQTVNPPGREIEAARYLDEVLGAVGIERTIVEPAPGRASLVARIRGTGAARPVLLLAHTDVVGVDASRWSTDPFGGEVRDGYAYGRGAIDDKGMLAANLECMLLVRRAVLQRGAPPARDIIFVAAADEEAGGRWGMEWLAENRPELLDAEFALNEGGRLRMLDGRPGYCAVQCAEKVPNRVRLLARGPTGHASIPLPGNAILRLGRALAAIGGHREPLRLTPTTRAFFGGLSSMWPEPAVRQAMLDLVSDDTERSARGALVLAGIPTFDAVLRNGISAVLVEGGVRHNVIPAQASASLDVRTLPGEPLEGVLERLRRVIDDPEVEVTGESGSAAPPPSPIDSPLFAAIAESARELDPGLVVVPYLSTGATDSATLRALGVKAYGILPFPMDEEDESRMHGHDERVPVASLLFGTRLIHRVVERICL